MKEKKSKAPRPTKKRGAKSRAKYIAKRKEGFRQRSAGRRKRDLDCRCPEGDDSEDGFHCRVSPFLFHRSNGTTREQEFKQEISEEVLQFYRDNPWVNQFVEVQDGANIADKLGIDPAQKGLFAKKLIPTGTRICPYVGEIYDKVPQHGQYIMELHSDCFLDPEYDTHDLGYLWHLDGTNTTDVPCPPNYARYINTMYPGDELAYHYNCSFEPDTGGYLVVWVIALEDIQPGQELIVDYGKKYDR